MQAADLIFGNRHWMLLICSAGEVLKLGPESHSAGYEDGAHSRPFPGAACCPSIVHRALILACCRLYTLLISIMGRQPLACMALHWLQAGSLPASLNHNT